MVTVGGIDTYYDYDERRWKYRRLGGGPVRDEPPRPERKDAKAEEVPAAPRRSRPAKRESAPAR
ncbi:hypothetical protein E1218_19830 [Kribbella turkmenica]|uniref:Uncharacterized protein n=1 Tax=Kribbella turkmenica TaxID=2530375 RepID=A0A4R4WWQ5_9ACTN|nr:hypothetical protein [Kribbella turkmenica]TDD22204.1 hypothetical protein E1218_19830 [Kribbella turkmenica]